MKPMYLLKTLLAVLCVIAIALGAAGCDAHGQETTVLADFARSLGLHVLSAAVL
jgi:hypothetical protein